MEHSITLFDACYWNAKPKAGEPRWVYDNKAKPVTLDWDDVVQMLSKHIVVDVKQKTPMFNAVEWLPLNGAETVEWGNKKYVRKCEKNMVDMHMLILDYDDGEYMDDVIVSMMKYAHCGYTSHSHSVEKDKFRIVLPLAEPIPAELLDPKGEYSILPALNTVFGHIDCTSFDRARSFFMPSCSEGNKHLAMAWSHDGELFDWTKLELTKRPVRKMDYTETSTDIVGMFKRTGLYVSKDSGARHTVVCPWSGDHTSDKESGAAVWEGQGFNCMHSHCRDKSFKDLMDYFETKFTSEEMVEFGMKKQFTQQEKIEWAVQKQKEAVKNARRFLGE